MFERFIILLYFYVTISASPFPYVYPRLELEATASKAAGDPLIITPYLENGKIELARNLSRVSITEKLGFLSYAGFLTIDKLFNSNLYFWYFPSFSNVMDAPLVLWLQGGPGGSSLFGLFTELGPLIIKKKGFSLRKYHWARNSNLLFIDNPVGTGFSFTDDDRGYCSDEKCVAKGLYIFLKQFFTLFPNLKKNEFFITGESYTGKYLPSLAMEIHRQNIGAQTKINLKGLALGNAYCDPINQMDYGNYLYQHGLIDDNQRDIFIQMQVKIAEEINKGDFGKANVLMDQLMGGELTNFSYFKSFTGYDVYYNYLEPKSTDDMSLLNDLLNNDKVRQSVHVGGLPFHSPLPVALHLAYDILNSVAPYVAELLSHYRLMFYNGQLDIIVAYPLTENFLRHLNFSSSTEYETAPRKIWKVNNDIAGYVKKAGNLSEVLVRNAGHMVPHDQPKWAFDLITRFIKNTL